MASSLPRQFCSRAPLASFFIAFLLLAVSVGTAQLRLTVERTQPVRVTVFDILGRTVATPYSGSITGGNEVTIRVGHGLSPGLYLVRVEGEQFSATERLTIVR